MNMPVPANSKSNGTRIIACALLAAAILYLSIDGHHTIKLQILFPGSNRLCVDCFAEIEDSITWLHGWPIVFYIRNSMDIAKLNANNTVAAEHLDDPAYRFGSLPFDNSPTLAFSWLGLCLNIAILILFTIGTWVALSKFKLPPVRFTLRTMLAYMDNITKQEQCATRNL